MYRNRIPGIFINSDICDNNLPCIHPSRIKTQPTFSESKGHCQVCTKGRSQFLPVIRIYPGRQIHCHFKSRRLVQFPEDLRINTFHRAGKPDPENGIYYSSIFTRIQVMHLWHFVISCNLHLFCGFRCHLFFFSREIKTD